MTNDYASSGAIQTDDLPYSLHPGGNGGFTCLVSLLLLLLAKTTHMYTEVVGTVEVSSPTYAYVEPGRNGAMFVAWATNWKQQIAQVQQQRQIGA